jgi:hypothetical protein
MTSGGVECDNCSDVKVESETHASDMGSHLTVAAATTAPPMGKYGGRDSAWRRVGSDEVASGAR